MKLQSAVALVTGGTGGLGRRICLALARQGVHVAVVYHQRKAEAEKVAAGLRELKVKAAIAQVDVTIPESVEALVGQVSREFGRIDILVNDAAYNKWIPYAELDKLTIDDWKKILTTNLDGPFHCIKAVAPVMKAQQQGRIINIASVAGLAPTGSSIAYAVSKAALIHLTKCMAVSLAPDVLVNSIAPGFLEGTRMTENLAPEYREKVKQASLLKRAADKDDIAEAIVELCRTDSITGQTLAIDSGRVFH
jgi:3-oxoacyl-[acyl-carrier protein] reductase